MLSLLARRNRMFAGPDKHKRNPLAGVDLVLWGIPLAMVFFAGILIASTQREADYADWYQHWVIAAVGMVIAIALSRLPLQRLKPLQWPIYGATVASLIAVRVDLIRPTAMIGLPWLLVFVQPDLGTSLVFAAILLVMLFWSGMPGSWVLLLLSPILSAVIAGVWPWALVAWMPVMGWLALKSLPWKRTGMALVLAIETVFAVATPWLWNHALLPHQRARLTIFLDPSQDPLGSGYHLLQSTVGIGSGGLFGMGLMHGTLTKLRFIPEQHTDFIFSALGEEMGFIGSALAVIGFAVLMRRLLQIASAAGSDYEALTVVGIGAMLMFQVVVNINMTIGLGPITGIPLPFLSYGRSAMLVNFISLGLVASVARHSSKRRQRS